MPNIKSSAKRDEKSKELRAKNRADKTVVIVTHRASAGAIADDTYTLSNGTLV